MKKLILFLFIVFLLPLVISLDEVYKVDTDIDFIHTVTSQNEPTDNIVANITITDPFGRVLIAYQPMTYIADNKTFNYTLPRSLTNEDGLYERCIFASNGSDWAEPKCYEFEVTKSGTQPTTATGMIYLVLLLFLLVFLVISVWGAFRMPTKHKRNQLDEIIELNYNKYAKYLLTIISWVLMVSIFYIGWNLAYGFLELDTFANVFRFLFYMTFAISFPLVIFIGVICLINWVNDNKIAKELERGFTSIG